MSLGRRLYSVVNLNLTFLIFLFGILSVTGVSQNPEIIDLEEILPIFVL